MKENEEGNAAHLRIELIDSSHGFLDTAIFNSLANLHTFGNLGMVDIRGQTSLSSKLDCSIREAFDQEIVQD